MNDRVVIPVPGLGVLALDPESYRAALAEGAKVSSTPPESTHPAEYTEPLMDAEQLSTVLGVPATWLEQAAREGRIPSLQFGRWRRFRRSEVEAAVQRSNGHT
jgi:excisionase family DNA binding protein